MILLADNKGPDQTALTHIFEDTFSHCGVHMLKYRLPIMALLVDVRAVSLSTFMGVDNIRFGWDTEVNQLLIHNASFTICMLSIS